MTNMAMQINSQQIQTKTEQTKKPDPKIMQAAPAVTPTRSAAEPAVRNAFPAQVNQQARMWEGSVRASQTNPAMPPLTSALPAVGGPGQVGIMNTSGVVNPVLSGRSSFPDMAGYNQGVMSPPGAVLSYDLHGFPPPLSTHPAGPMSPEVRPFSLCHVCPVFRGFESILQNYALAGNE